MRKWQRVGIQFFDDNDHPVGDMRFAVISEDKCAVTQTYATLSELDAAIEVSENHPIARRIREQHQRLMERMGKE